MTALSALAAAVIVAPPDTQIPTELETAIRHACRGAWRAVEVLLAGDVLRGRLGKTRDTFVRDGVEGVLGLFGNVAVRASALAELRAARQAGTLDGELDTAEIVATIRIDGAAVVGRGAVGAIRLQLATTSPELATALGEHEVGALLVDTARALFRHVARDPELARWAIGPTGLDQRDRALTAFAELIGSAASVDELDALIAIPIHLDENVQFTVYRPRAIDPGRWHPLLAFAHLADRRPGDDEQDPVEEVRRQAQSVLGDRAREFQNSTQDASAAVPAEGELTFVPEMPGIEFNPPRRSFLWLETVHREEFRMRAGLELDGKTVRGRLTVFLGHIAIGEVALSVRVDARPEPATTRREPVHARAYRKIFASYSHKDIAIVNQFETYARALGDEYLRDWIHLRTGEVWNDRLRQLIEQADAFQLFWSWNSMKSKFVRQEYEHALALNRASFVRPTYWEDPMPTAPGLPPEALLRLHFQKLGAAMISPTLAHEDYAPTEPRQARASAGRAPSSVSADTRLSRPARRGPVTNRNAYDDDDLGPAIDPPAPDASYELEEAAFERESIPIRPAAPSTPAAPIGSPMPPPMARPSPDSFERESVPIRPAAPSAPAAARPTPSRPSPVLDGARASSFERESVPIRPRAAESSPMPEPFEPERPPRPTEAQPLPLSRQEPPRASAPASFERESVPIRPRLAESPVHEPAPAQPAPAASTTGKQKKRAQAETLPEDLELPAKVPNTRPQSPPPMPAPPGPSSFPAAPRPVSLSPRALSDVAAAKKSVASEPAPTLGQPSSAQPPPGYAEAPASSAQPPSSAQLESRGETPGVGNVASPGSKPDAADTFSNLAGAQLRVRKEAVSPYAATIPQPAYKGELQPDPHAPTGAAPQLETPKETLAPSHKPLALAIIVVLIVIAAVLVVLLAT